MNSTYGGPSRSSRTRATRIVLLALTVLALVTVGSIARTCASATGRRPVDTPSSDTVKDPAKPTRVVTRRRTNDVESPERADDASVAIPVVTSPETAERRVEVHVVAAETRQPVSGAAFRLITIGVEVSVAGRESEREPGRYDVVLSGAAPRWESIAASATGYVESRATLDGDTPILIVLGTGATVECSVERTSGDGVSGALVYLGPRELVSDVAGLARFELVPYDIPLRLVALVDGMRVEHPQPIRMLRNSRHRSIRIEVHAGLSLAIETVDTDGAAIPDAALRVVARTGAPAAQEGLTDSRGLVSLRGLHPGEYWVRVLAEGYEPASILGVRLTGDDSLTVVLEAARPHFVRGIVVSEAGRPIEGATVRLTGAPGNRVATTGADGVFDFSELRARVPRDFGKSRPVATWPPLLITASKEGWVSPGAIAGQLDRDDLRVTLGRPTAVRGRIVNALGQPVPECSVSFRIDGAGMQSMGLDGQRSDDANRVRPNGAFLWEGVFAGEGVIVVQARTGAESRAPVRLVAGETVDVGDLVLRMRSRFEVAAMTSTGQIVPAMDGIIRLLKDDGRPIPDGHSFLAGGSTVYSGRVTVAAMSREWLAKTWPVVELRRENTAAVQIELLRAGSIAVVAFDRGDPVADVDVRLEYLGPHDQAFAERGTLGVNADGSRIYHAAVGWRNDGNTGAEREVTFQPVPPGRYRVLVSGADGATADLEFELDEGASRRVSVSLD